ncbi:hypothetical protein [Bradyrhizobium ganzhouense]|uniref:hypothetical protein n=1 Tax=Bradyrhizobium ganzhouense TaxID=1179767 RepID=UPI003CE765B5
MKMEKLSSSLPKITQKLSKLRWARRLSQLFSPRFNRFFEQWRGQGRTLQNYWSVYGGRSALLKSPYLHIALLLTGVCFLHWPKADTAAHAADVAVGVLPNLLGFTVGALAIVLAFSSADIFRLLSEDGEPTSFFLTLTANLVHFIFVQVAALVTGIVAKIVDFRILDVLSLFLLFYAVLVTLSAAFQLFQTARIYNAKASLPERPAETLRIRPPKPRVLRRAK